MSDMKKWMEMTRKSQEASNQRFADESKKRLSKIIATKLTTTFIGSLAAFEKAFGFLWGQGKRDSEKTQEEKEFYNIWESVRTDVLNNGNNQLRNIQNELQNHNISWNRHTLVIKNEETDDRDRI